MLSEGSCDAQGHPALHALSCSREKGIQGHGKGSLDLEYFFHIGERKPYVSRQHETRHSRFSVQGRKKTAREWLKASGVGRELAFREQKARFEEQGQEGKIACGADTGGTAPGRQSSALKETRLRSEGRQHKGCNGTRAGKPPAVRPDAFEGRPQRHAGG